VGAEYLVLHLVGDYLLQTDWMAQNKKKSTWPCLAHILAYMVPFVIVTHLVWWQLLLIAAQHFWSDRSNIVVWLMKIKGSEKFATGLLAPWSIVVTDNVLHVVWIYLVVWLGGYYGVG
jgi:hypothetical protein